ncbi:glycosyltransferase family 4 protein [Granulosicoccus antarcticus]|uniref:Teichuronic acid biosynthesis glycosyltransferase TuaH n=1 Tax=Granulosicoccus antarcticus IMCC3135 TaxID=1192854 RepID=A0A2Z2NKC1_9GAMM|nr:glycosyltransferase [Granulosicoccus antarcticus]ASJ71619.1 Putative teichuronic acid biosynthesis glycosyltransferase TuaH [Granulosicoccus antarcticus IMCC3135]
MNSEKLQLTRLTRNLRALSSAAAKSLHEQSERAAEELTQFKAVSQLPVMNERAAMRGKRGRVAVVCWDLGHNPAGRAYVLYKLLEKEWNVDLVGPVWSRYGDDLWKPIRDADLRVRSFRCNTLQDFMPKAELLAASQVYDLVYVCKPRLPSLYLGTLIKQVSNCPMIVDVDDFELAFFKTRKYASFDEISADATTALREPYEELATRYCQSLVAEADSVTVSNIALRKQFGGHMIRHARDESEFVNTPKTRRLGRARLGIADNEFALVFLGTPRPHKGVGEVVRALHELNDPSIVFHVVGKLTDESLCKQLEHYPDARVTFHPNCTFEELPAILSAADLVPLIQDLDHPISQHQIPAKVSDALSLGVPVIATAAPPLKDLIAAGAIIETDLQSLAAAIRFQCDESRNGRSLAHECRRNFEGELGMGINRVRLDFAIKEATARHAGMAPALLDLLTLVRNTYTLQRKAEYAQQAKEFSLPVNSDNLKSKDPHRKRRSSQSWFSSLPGKFNKQKKHDIAFFWKQNDTGLYGRRSDMIAKYLAASGRVNRIVHFDAPVSINSLNVQFSLKTHRSGSQQDRILHNIVDRQLGIVDDEITRHRTFVNSSQPKRGVLLGKPIAKRDEYSAYVREQLLAHDMQPETTHAWFCPIVWDASELIDNIPFASVTSDLIDDQRAWDANTPQAKRLDDCYRTTLSKSDLVFANCQSLADAMLEYAPDIHVVPNGAERFSELPEMSVPEALAAIKGPVVGYVGNLRDRIDWMLLHDVVSAMPDVSFVFLGPSDDTPNAVSLAKHANVHMLGVLPYDDLPRWLSHFDVGMMPHINNRLTERMNPLKIYNYFAAGLPIVASEVNNLGLLGETLQIARNADEFVAALNFALQGKPDTRSVGWQRTMDSIAWDVRVGEILDTLESSIRPRFRYSA